MPESPSSKLIRTAYRSPRQNGVAEHRVGSCHRELLDQVIVFNEAHLRRLVRENLRSYHEDRTHDGLGKTPPGSGLWSEGRQHRPDLWPCPVSVGSTIRTHGVQLHKRASRHKHAWFHLLLTGSSDRRFCSRVVEQESAEPRRQVVGLERKVSATPVGENQPWRTVAFKSERLIQFEADAFLATHS
jgi:hypothetical protein